MGITIHHFSNILNTTIDDIMTESLEEKEAIKKTNV